jgi:DNA-directed RNA polymerase specialized sigma24 family protein
VRRDVRRARIAEAIARCTMRDRELLALLLVERLTPAEAAVALGLSLERVRRRHAALIARLARELAAFTVPVEPARVRMRRAS